VSQSSGNASGPKQTLIEDETQFKGVLQSRCPIVVKGEVEGEVSGPSLHVSESGSVSGTVKVESLDSRGSLAGTFEAGHVQLSGAVRDKTVIRARSLEVKLEAESGGIEVSFGDCDLEVGDVPTKEQAVSDALASAKAEDKPVESVEADAKAPADAESATAKGEADAGAEAKSDEAGGSGDDKKRRNRRESTSPASA
jgi:cytoskeletal protein CcmA (bactofilin family)